MSQDDRSPCIQCDRLRKSKSECATSCEKLKIYQESLPRFTLWRGSSNDYDVQGLQRTTIYRIYE